MPDRRPMPRDIWVDDDCVDRPADIHNDVISVPGPARTRYTRADILHQIFTDVSRDRDRLIEEKRLLMDAIASLATAEQAWRDAEGDEALLALETLHQDLLNKPPLLSELLAEREPSDVMPRSEVPTDG